MTENIYLTQAQLADHWQVSEGTLDRWRSEGRGPIYLKPMGSIRHRLRLRINHRKFSKLKDGVAEWHAAGMPLESEEVQ